MQKIFVTSALLYANGPLHLGHLVEYIQTDIYVRYLRLRGEDVLYCCADDAHGAPIQINAMKANVAPEKLIKKFFREHTRDFSRFQISFDKYYTTHSAENEQLSKHFFLQAKKNSLIEKRPVTQLYCRTCRLFLPDRFVRGTCPRCQAKDQYGDVCEKCGQTYKPTELAEPRCAVCAGVPVARDTEHYFFLLSKMKHKLEKWLKSSDLQKEVVNSVWGWIREGLSDWDISRNSPYFGFRIPGDDDLYFYVWWDAPFGYIASLGNLTGNGEAEWQGRRIVHVIGKDIIYFHFLFWPAVLMAAGYKPPDKIVVHGFLTVNGEKMSKSRGTFITAEEFARENEPEHLRYFLAGALGKKLADVDFNWADFNARVNNELVANIGNFCHRTVSFAQNYLGSRLCSVGPVPELLLVRKEADACARAYQELNTTDAVKRILSISSVGNRFFQDSRPWDLVKKDPEKARQVISVCAEIVKAIAVTAKPILPKSAGVLEKQLNLPDVNWRTLDTPLGERTLCRAERLFEKAQDQECLKLMIRAGRILKARLHPDAGKLIILEVDLGGEKRQVIAGLRDYYKARVLVGRNILVLCNLKPAVLRGMKSEGMLLAAQKDSVVKVLETEAKPGSVAACSKMSLCPGMITIKDFEKHNKLTLKGGRLHYNGRELSCGGFPIKADMPDESTVR